MDLRPHPDVVWRRLEDEVVLVHLRTNRIYSLNQTAARAWELMSSGEDRARIEETLLDEFDVSATEVRTSLDELLEQLAATGLLATG